jgi:hypothetical protein
MRCQVGRVLKGRARSDAAARFEMRGHRLVEFSDPIF